MKHFFCLVLVLTAGSVMVFSQDTIPFDESRWNLANARVVTHLGRQGLTGMAILKDTVFGDGVIEADVAVTGGRAYPGIIFRIQSPGNHERVYLRPHRSGRVPPSLYTDVVQYVPSFSGSDSWQLYSGDGYTAGAVIPAGEWCHVRIEVKGTRARVFIGGQDQPALVIHELQRGSNPGGIALTAGMDGAAVFSNFSLQTGVDLQFDPPTRQDPGPGVIAGWEISRSFPALSIDTLKCPPEQGLTGLNWQQVTARPDGLVDINRYLPRAGAPATVFARTTLSAPEAKTLRLQFGYSDQISVFLNGRLLFAADSSYTLRDPSFLGIAGYFDQLFLPLQKGSNELLLAVTESMGGWGFMARDGDAVFLAPGVASAWQTGRCLQIPESAVWDPASQAIYVSNYDPFNRSQAEGLQSISKFSATGQLIKADWFTGVKNPTGLAVHGGKLYAVEPRSLAIIDLATGELSQRMEVPGAMMLNDIAIAPDGTVYLSDSAKGCIVRGVSGQFETWLAGAEVVRPNGVCVREDQLIWGNNGDGMVKAVHLQTKAVTRVASLGGGIIDGIAAAPGGQLLVTHNEGRLFRISPAGEVTRLLDTSVTEQNLADFAWIPDQGLAIFPGWVTNRLVAYRISQ